MSMPDEITVSRHDPASTEEWERFLDASNNGTVFHSLRFLAYHRAGAFDTHHLVFHEGKRLLALLPGALVSDGSGRRILQSPYGASIGGPVVARQTRLSSVIAMVNGLKQYVAAQGWAGVTMRLGPAVYMHDADENVGFALATQGFRLDARWLCPIVKLSAVSAPESFPVDAFSERKRTYVRGAARQGMQVREAGPDGLERFHVLLSQTMERHGAQPTHDRSDIERLFQLVPDRLRLFICSKEDADLSAVLVFMLNRVAAYTFYICGMRKEQATTYLLHHIMGVMAREGICYLDLGPSASSEHVNAGNIMFKESLGARGYCRDSWVWDTKGREPG